MEPRGTGQMPRPVWYAGSDSVRGEFWTMLHLPYTLMVLSFVILGAALAPTVSWTLLGGTLLAYFLGLGIGAHFLDQIPGMGSRYVRHWPSWALWTGGFLSIAGAVTIGVVGAIRYVGLPLLILVGVQALCAVGYPLARWFGGALHRDSVFALSWGSLPFVTSYYAQAGTLSFLSVTAAVPLAVVALVEIRLSRASRRLRAEARTFSSHPSLTSSRPGCSFRDFDRALQVLSLATIAVAFGLFGGRIALAIW